ncbi:hypothetical protein WR25_24825 [Diploscapter pachys]|uniref:Tyrosine-protein phosphatase domain-containing protein n=1 Tax=Diploscapter pachys TaxID=2018661 RepID=A0A2A2KK17_9BILA|nr:hypothetical protein WR25_24825 [Diploscapter pachys]
MEKIVKAIRKPMDVSRRESKKKDNEKKDSNKSKRGKKKDSSKRESRRDKKLSRRSATEMLERRSKQDRSKRTKRGEQEPDSINKRSELVFRFAQIVKPLDGSDRTPRQKELFRLFLEECGKMTVRGLVDEYNQKIRFYMPSSCTQEAFDCNMDKNRYKDVICCDQTRVKIQDGDPNDYIHANWVKGLNANMVLTQGPIEQTTFDFWRMVLHIKAHMIIMLCEVEENGKKKCHVYWPAEPNRELRLTQFRGDPDDVIIVKKVSQEETPSRMKKYKLLGKHWVSSNFEVTRIRNASTLTPDQLEQARKSAWKVKHHQCVTWPDKTVPKSGLAILRKWHYIRDLGKDEPCIIHCSAGIGRTGTFIAIELAIQTLLNCTELKVLDLVRKLRDIRPFSVQVEVQYLCLVLIVLEFGVKMNYLDVGSIKLYEILKADITQFVEAHRPTLNHKDCGKVPDMKALRTTEENVPKARTPNVGMHEYANILNPGVDSYPSLQQTQVTQKYQGPMEAATTRVS